MPIMTFGLLVRYIRIDKTEDQEEEKKS
ncbi:hypothetical protein HID58_024285 [Brassica napus]|uniref:Uncharacterized protein n=1 Tax=Brassica napus TaxID=3708 RepID=A0ABQ8D4F6_BRANA|nr:hypothetical protein HID58_024285 [Brassica napus]